MEARSAHVPMLDTDKHPAHDMYRQALAGVTRLDDERGGGPGPHSSNLAGSLTSAALGAGLIRIDQVALDRNANRMYALQENGLGPLAK